MNLGKQGADLCSSSLTQHFVAGFFARRATGGATSTTWSTSTGAGAT